MAERDLWRAILALAVSDTLYEGDAPVACDARDAAREWFRFGGRGFRFTCVMAGFDPDAVQARYMAGKFSAVAEAGRAFMHHTGRPPRAPEAVREWPRVSARHQQKSEQQGGQNGRPNQ
ncbi:hypothetical protein D1822_10945 [Phaeobacter inhibens]|uniref:hypothetical protein n=1 Tax=Phaeobacter inhibens TaxID=221822 RepID=UPI0001633195|nr:hypothetical protein [Phaeobacter inhibens]AUQ46606.1 hypothetical protein PhaeoP10_02276 [Phaeobacter inhibens]AXT23297.1 hypothetical protein D1822_10945 [Phaeobacter inhibens]